MFSLRTLGLALLITGLALPVIVYVGGHVYNTNLASYGGPPNQGAMILTYFAIVISVVVGGCMALAGFVMSLLSLRKATPRPTLRA